MTVRSTIARNTLFNGLGRLWGGLIGLALVAYIVAKIGVEDYGLWAVVAGLTGYAALLDVGIGSAYAKYIAEHAARDERSRISEVVSTGFFFYLLFGSAFLAVTWPLVDVLLGLAESLGSERLGDLGNVQVLADLRFLLRGSLVLFVLAQCIGPFTAVQTGLQRMGVTNAIGAVTAVVKVVATVAFLEAGFGVRGLVMSQAITTLAVGAMSVGAAFRLCPGLRLLPLSVTRSAFGKLFRFGWRAQVSRLSNLVMFETDVLIITLVLGDLRLAGLYMIGLELANKMRQAPGVLVSALVPAVSGLDAAGAEDALRRLYVKSTKYVALATAPLVAFVAGSAGLLMQAWQGFADDLATAAIVTQILALGYVANIVPGAGVTVALGKGRPDVQMKAGLISMSVNFLLTLTLVYTIGFWGVPLATALSMYVSWGWFSRAMGRLLKVGPRMLFRQALLWPFAAAVPGFLFCVVMDRWSGALTTRWESLAAVAALGVLFFGLYLAMLRTTPVFDEEDLGFFDETLRLDRVPGYRAWSRALREG